MMQDVDKVSEPNRKKKSTEMKLDWFDKNLISDNEAGNEKFTITLENIPKSCRDDVKHPIKFDSSRPVAELIKVMRHKVRKCFDSKVRKS